MPVVARFEHSNLGSVVNVYEKTTCQDNIKFISDNYLQMHKTLQLFTNMLTLKTNIFTSIKVIKNMYIPTLKLLKMPSSLKLGLNKNCSLFWA